MRDRGTLRGTGPTVCRAQVFMLLGQQWAPNALPERVPSCLHRRGCGDGVKKSMFKRTASPPAPPKKNRNTTLSLSHTHTHHTPPNLWLAGPKCWVCAIKLLGHIQTDLCTSHSSLFKHLSRFVSQCSQCS